ncbi:MAG: 23S rRNA (guanosine(2251)-2'-O)-methyltransferase RlmB [Rhodospirillaceae bacterium]
MTGNGRKGPKPTFLYGVHAAAAAWLNPERECRRMLLTEAGQAALAGVLERARSLGLKRPPPNSVAKPELERLLPQGAVHQGVALEVAPLPEVDLEDLLRLPEDQHPGAVVVLDQVTDPHNIGAIMRSAAAFGAGAVIVTERHAPEATGVLAKSASGAVDVVPLVRVTNLARTLEDLQKAGYWCVGLDESGRRSLPELDITGRLALVLGAEGAGLRRLTRERCDEIARLPTTGPISSLNVSNAAAVALYEWARVRKKG